MYLQRPIHVFTTSYPCIYNVLSMYLQRPIHVFTPSYPCIYTVLSMYVHRPLRVFTSSPVLIARQVMDNNILVILLVTFTSNGGEVLMMDRRNVHEQLQQIGLLRCLDGPATGILWRKGGVVDKWRRYSSYPNFPCDVNAAPHIHVAAVVALEEQILTIFNKI